MTELLQRTFSAAEYTRQQDPDADTSSENEADLHTMGKLFLPPFLQKLFDITVPLQLYVALVHYDLIWQSIRFDSRADWYHLI